MHRIVLAVLLLSPVSLAQLTEKQAVKQLKGDLKVALKEFKQSLESAANNFEAAVDSTDSLLDSGADVPTFVLNLSGATAQVQEDARVAIEFAYIRAAQGTGLALEGLDPAIDLSLGYPKALLPGSGDILDDYEADVHKHLTKVYAKLNKRLGKSAKAAEKSGVGLTYRLVPPVDAFGWSAATTGEFETPSTPLRIDTVLAASELEADNDGVMVVAGIANAGASDVNLDVIAQTFDHDAFTATPALGTDRWSIQVDDYDDTGGLPEVIYSLEADQDQGGSFTSVAFGVR